MTNPRPFIFSPHYLFGDEHQANCSFNYQEQRLFGQPIDVAKGQLCISIPEDSPIIPNIGSRLDLIHLHVANRDFILPCMYVQKVNQSPYHPIELHLHSQYFGQD